MPDGAPSRYVVVDDTDPRISYKGQWSLDTSGDMDGSDWSNRGPTWNHTLTRAQGEASFSFRFNGTYFHIYGSYDVKNNKPAPKWRCQVNGTTIDNNPMLLSSTRANFFGFCRYALPAGEHTITLNVTVPSDGYFWLDHIDYTPLLPQPTRNEVMLYQDYDTSVIYEPRDNWKTSSGDSDKATSIPGSTITMDFFGVQFNAFGSAPGNITNTAHYSVDDGSPVNFVVPATPPGMDVLLGQPLFTASDLSSTDHKIVITFTGETRGAPLDFGYAMITLPPGVGPDLPPPPRRSSRPPVGAIMGGVIGGVAGLVLLICLGMFLRKRRRRKYAEQKDISGATTFNVHYIDKSHNFSESKHSALLTLTPGSLPSQPNLEPQLHIFPVSSSSLSDTTFAASQSQILRVQHIDSGQRMAQLDPINDSPPHYTKQ